MSIDFPVLLLIIACAAVTFIPRVIPFMVVRNIQLPVLVGKWLSFIPVCIFTALIIDSFLLEGEGAVAVDWAVLCAMVPTVLIAVWTKDLSLTVLTGIVSMALIRFLL